MNNIKFSARVRNTIKTGQMYLTVRDLRYMLSIINEYLDQLQVDRNISQYDINRCLTARKACQKLLNLRKGGKV